MRWLSEGAKVWAFAARGVIMTWRNVFAIFELFFWPLIGLFSVGLLTQFLALGPDTISFVLVGVVAMNTVQIAQLDLSYALLYDVWSKCLKQCFVAPVQLWQIVVGSGLVGLVRGLLVFLLMLACGWWFFGMSLAWQLWWPLSRFFLGLFVMAVIEGLIVMALVLRFGHRAEITAWAISYLVLLLAGLYYPVSLLPPWVQKVAYSIPLTYFLEDCRALYGFPATVSRPGLYGWGLSLLYLGLGYLLLRWSLQAARKQGTLLRLSE